MTTKPRQKPRKKSQTATKKAGEKAGPLVAQQHGGAIYQGAPANPVAGPGRPKDEVREKLLGLANGKGVPFLDKLLDGEVDVAFYTTCPKCNHREELPEDDEYLDKIMDRIGDQVSASVDQRLKGNDQALKYGLGTKDEIDIMSHPDAQRFATAYREALAAESPEVYERVMDRVAQALGRTT